MTEDSDMTCVHCGEPFSLHRATDLLCPGKRPDGTTWRGQWEGVTTRFEMGDEDRARRQLAKAMRAAGSTVALDLEKCGVSAEKGAALRADILRAYPNLAWAIPEDTSGG